VNRALAAAYAHGPGKEIKVGPAPEAEPAPGVRHALPATDAARLLVEVLSPSRWEPWNQYNDHRSYPSPRAAYLVEVEIVDGNDRWLFDPLRRATIAPNDQARHKPGLGGPALDRAVRLEFVRRPDRLSTGYGEFAEALTELEVGHVAGALVENAPRFGLRAYADGDGVTLEPGDFRTPEKMPKRSSGLGPRGIGADPRPLPIETLTAFVRSMEQLPEGTLRHPGLQHRLAVHNVAGARDGWYTVDVRRNSAAMDAVQGCHGHPRAVIDVSGMNLALVMAADVPAAVKAGGSGEYQALLRAAGALGQHLCTAAAKAGMFCRPLRSFDDAALEAAAGFPLEHSLLYVLLAGRPKVTGPAYDLSPLEAS
jgi:hypothetical protein